MKIKTTIRYYFTSLGWLLSRTWKLQALVGHVENLTPFYTAGGNVKRTWCGKVWQFLKTLNTEVPSDPQFYSQKNENKCPYRILYMNVLISIFHNRLKEEMTQSTDTWIHDIWSVHTHYSMFCSYRKDWVVTNAQPGEGTKVTNHQPKNY